MCQMRNATVTAVALGVATLLACSSGRDLGSRDDRSQASRDSDGKHDRPNDDDPDGDESSRTDAEGGAGSPAAPPNPGDGLRERYGIDSDPPHELFDPAVVRHYDVAVDPDEWAHIN